MLAWTAILRSQGKKVELRPLTQPLQKATYELPDGQKGYLLQVTHSGKQIRFETLVRASHEASPPLSVSVIASGKTIQGIEIHRENGERIQLYWEASPQALSVRLLPVPSSVREFLSILGVISTC